MCGICGILNLNDREVKFRMEVKRKIFKALPGSAQRWLGYVYSGYTSFRYRKVFRETYAFLQESQWWSRERLEEYQLEQLSNKGVSGGILHHCWNRGCRNDKQMET